MGRQRRPMERTGRMGISTELRQELASPTDDWMRQSWREVALAVRSKDREAVIAALQYIYEIAPRSQIEQMADDYLAGVKR